MLRSVATLPELAPDPPGMEPDTRSPLRRRITVGVTLAGCATILGLWIYTLFFYDPGLMIDELADRRFPTQAERVCSTAQSRLEQLPPATQARSAGERAATVEQGDTILQAMVGELRLLVPQGQGRITSGINEWVSDWETYLNDRAEYVDGLRQDPTTRFQESRKGNRQVSLAIDSFAQVNRMDSCTTPGDVG